LLIFFAIGTSLYVELSEYLFGYRDAAGSNLGKQELVNFRRPITKTYSAVKPGRTSRQRERGATPWKHLQFRDGRMNLEEANRSTFEGFRIAGFSECSG